MGKVVSAEDAVSRIGNGMTVAVGGTGAVMEPDLVLETLERRFLDSGQPQNLTVVSPMLPGDRPGQGGLNCFAHDGMVARIIGSSFSVHRHPKLIELIRECRCEGYTVSMGAIVQLMTAIASRKPGIFTKAGLYTFLDPRLEGGCMNECSKNLPVRLEQLDDEEYLFYPAFPIHIAIIRGTTADENGYISFEEEPNSMGMLEIAAAAKASGGHVIGQVKRLARANSLDPRLVRVPGPLVDMIVIHSRQTQVSPTMSDPLNGWNPFLAGALKAPLGDITRIPLGVERLILRRAVFELQPSDVINIGAGVATDLPKIALEENILHRVVFTNEHGIFGGLVATAIGGSFVPALNADAIMDSAFQFNFYDAGGLDIAFLGIGQVDSEGNVNVSKFGDEWFGPGGFTNITDRTPRIVFCGSMTSGGLKVEIVDGRLRILQEGRFPKFISKVGQITFNGSRAYAKGQEVIYITERAVFRLCEKGLELIEIAPGIDLTHDVLAQVGFPLRIADPLRIMETRIFGNEPLSIGAQFQ